MPGSVDATLLRHISAGTIWVAWFWTLALFRGLQNYSCPWKALWHWRLNWNITHAWQGCCWFFLIVLKVYFFTYKDWLLEPPPLYWIIMIQNCSLFGFNYTLFQHPSLTPVFLNQILSECWKSVILDKLDLVMLQNILKFIPNPWVNLLY